MSNYKHFASKDELLIESLKEGFREIIDTLVCARIVKHTKGKVRSCVTNQGIPLSSLPIQHASEPLKNCRLYAAWVVSRL